MVIPGHNEVRNSPSGPSWHCCMILFPVPTAVSASLRLCDLALNLAADSKKQEEKCRASFSFVLLVLFVVQHFMFIRQRNAPLYYFLVIPLYLI